MDEKYVTKHDLYEKLWASRDFEINHLWQRSIFLATFIVALFTIYFSVLNTFVSNVPFEDIKPLLCKQGVAIEDIIHEDVSLNTREQAIQIINLACEKKWQRLILVASPEHQYRAYLTFLKEILQKNKEIVLMNSSAENLKWFESCGWGIRFDRLEQEFLRIEKYSVMGHLATYQEAIDYQKWKELQ